ncbi:MAG TPA: hypothetical protein VN231_02445, partial [Allosphingosinicella sp.]|nr:hypothetical protein [Allosphingosinicella sp.]
MIHSIALLAALAAAPDAAADKPPVPLPAGPPRGMVSHSVEGPAGLGCFRVAPGAGAGLAEAVACPAV